MGQPTDRPVPRLTGRAADFARVLREHLPELHERYGVSSLGIFGSYARGEESELSDLDLLVEFDVTPGLFDFFGLELYLSDLLSVDVELVMRAALRRRMGKEILKEVVQV